MQRFVLYLALAAGLLQATSVSAQADTPVLRVARPTNDMEMVLKFYCDGVGLDVIYEFHDHAGFDGIMLGRSGAPYHLEFTQVEGHTVPGAPSQDNLLVFYLPDAGKYRSAVERMRALGYSPVPSFNPYWDVKGTTFEDGEGYRVVFYNGVWPY